MRNYTNNSRRDKRWFKMGASKTNKINMPKYRLPFGGIRL